QPKEEAKLNEGMIILLPLRLKRKLLSPQHMRRKEEWSPDRMMTGETHNRSTHCLKRMMSQLGSKSHSLSQYQEAKGKKHSMSSPNTPPRPELIDHGYSVNSRRGALCVTCTTIQDSKGIGQEGSPYPSIALK
ncbi:hypothetical protein AMTR_s00124p00015120, partial [Amborella trichopoda]